MTPAAFFAVVVASAVGSVHCAAMCGGFVAAYAGADETPRGSRVAAHALYNGGQLFTYLGLGAAAGALGGALDLAGRATGIAHAAGIATGLLLLLSGAAGLVPRRRFVRLRRGSSRPLASRITRLFASFRSQPPRVRALLLGLSSTLLPCGWLYAFAALAASTGNAFDGALLMMAFWLGSVPIMIGVGVTLQTAAKTLWSRVPRLRPVLVLGVGAFTLFSRFQGPAFAASSTGASVSAASTKALPTNSDCPHHRRGQHVPGDKAP